MAGIYGEDTLRNLAAATPTEKVEHIEAFDTPIVEVLRRPGRTRARRRRRVASQQGLKLCEQLRAAFHPVNYKYRWRSRLLAWQRELRKYILKMRVLAASLVGNRIPEHIKLVVFMDVGPSRTHPAHSCSAYTRAKWESRSKAPSKKRITTYRLLLLRRSQCVIAHNAGNTSDQSQNRAGTYKAGYIAGSGGALYWGRSKSAW
ncbi:LOW QUALITY PROTEIN: Gag protein [Phytophthora palmivora]|uniref:Gag protein n=1 Tax=Phytophthora palmivora TaxID=4796 RepID=A0A2P4XNY2_9STRA|nr:LOW QUALITY PROTEIN: Gag protein [Phytophthora palmivora]